MLVRTAAVSLSFLWSDVEAVRPSAGCGSAKLATKVYTIEHNDPGVEGGKATRWYWLNVPSVYETSTPAPLVINFHGFYDNAHYEMYEDSIPKYVEQEKLNVVSVYPVGSGMDNGDSGDSHAWNVDGNMLDTNPGPMGSVCTSPRNPMDAYTCYTSCTRGNHTCTKHLGCNFASCMDDVGFISAMLDRLEATMCIDVDHIHVTGISSGGLMAYQTALSLSDRVASVAPIAGSRILGYNFAPNHPVSLLDSHGYADIYVPANATSTYRSDWPKPGPHGSSRSEDEFYYTPTPEVMKMFAKTAGCAGDNLPWVQGKYDGNRGYVCNQPFGKCTGGAEVIQCVGEWGHTWPLTHTHPLAYAEITLDFFKAHPKIRGGDQAVVV